MKNSQRPKKTRQAVIDDIAALRAFVMPENYPFLLEVYIKQGKTESVLLEDIRKAREFYKESVGCVKKDLIS